MLEQQWAEYQTDPHSFDVRSVHSGSFDYQVDFKSMVQTNLLHDSHTVRAVRRVPR